MELEELTEKLVVNYGLSLEAADWVETWIRCFVEQEIKNHIINPACIPRNYIKLREDFKKIMDSFTDEDIEKWFADTKI